MYQYRFYRTQCSITKKKVGFVDIVNLKLYWIFDSYEKSPNQCIKEYQKYKKVLKMMKFLTLRKMKTLFQVLPMLM